jgi:acyl-coenzyme A synthetase/AMP-(fatty) acid ligase
MIKTSGYRISPGEVEDVLLTCKSIHQTCVIGLEHPELGQGILAVITLNENEMPPEKTSDIEKSLLKHCQLSLANYMVPQKVIILSDLPYNANGKVDRQKLKKNYHDFFISA